MGWTLPNAGTGIIGDAGGGPRLLSGAAVPLLQLQLHFTPIRKGPNRREFHAGPGPGRGLARADASRARSRLLLASRPVPFRWERRHQVMPFASWPRRLAERASFSVGNREAQAEPVELSQAGSRNQHPICVCVTAGTELANDRAMHGLFGGGARVCQSASFCELPSA